MPNDAIGGVLSDELAGVELTYTYSGGRRFRLSFTAEQASFALQTAPGTWSAPGTLPYRARKLRSGQYLVHWFGGERKVHVSLVIDLEQRRVEVAALMPGSAEFFDSATIDSCNL